MNPRVSQAIPIDDYKIKLTFSNNEQRIFDLKPYLNIGLFSELKDESLFKSIKPFMGSIQWNNGLDICPDTLYEESIKIH